MPSPWLSPDLDASRADMPRPEYPRPDFQRGTTEGFDWLNLNGLWLFEFDPDDRGEREGWFRDDAPFSRTIVVPFPWESHLAWGEGHVASNDTWFSPHAFLDPAAVDATNYRTQPRHEIGWYRREMTIPAHWAGKRTILHFGAVDWEARVWVNGQPVGTHEGGYSPFSLDITDACRPGDTAVLVVRTFDPNDHRALPAGKQINWYARTSGIWQTVFLEPHPASFISRVHVTPDVDRSRAIVQVDIEGAIPAGRLRIAITSPDGRMIEQEGQADGQPVEVAIPDPLLWEPETPHLYDAAVELSSGTEPVDCVRTSFGLRKVSTSVLPGTTTKYVFLNNHPVYLLGALNQSFNPWGVYTFPSDEAIQDDLRKAKEFGFNFLRMHIKVEDPRFLYWADRLGVLLMCDMPNFDRYGPDAQTRWEQTLRAAIDRDYNHPSVLAWCCFNETWGLGSRGYKNDKETQEWVRTMYRLARSLDPSRLVEDNSPCLYDHVETQVNSWHFYINDYEKARAHITEVVDQTSPGSAFNYTGGNVQGDEPLLNSEYGGISASAGDKDVSWCFKYLTNELRLHEKICGYVYTELMDIEWEHNGFLNYDRTVKAFGYDYRLINALDVVLLDGPPARTCPGGSRFAVDVLTSHFSSRRVDRTMLRWRLDSVDPWGEEHEGLASGEASIPFVQYRVERVHRAEVTLPQGNQLCTLHVWVEDAYGTVIARNFTHVEVYDGPLPQVDRLLDRTILRYGVGSYAAAHWSQGIVEEGEMVTGLGAGVFDYLIDLPDGLVLDRVERLELWGELSAGRSGAPQTEPSRWPSEVTLSVNGIPLGRVELEDAPADARGVLSYLHGIPGRYGELVRAIVTGDDLTQVLGRVEHGQVRVRYEVAETAVHPHGLALFGGRAGRYPVDPCVVMKAGIRG